MRTLAIGDIHGCSRAFDALLAIVAPRPDDRVVTLGDYVDRGPDSAGVLDRLARLLAAGRLVPILGNHEQMMLEAADDPSRVAEFLANGGDRTLASYGPATTLADVPSAHWAFLRRCVDGWETLTHLFVHANAYPDVPLAEQPAYMLRWEPFGNGGPPPAESGTVLVCGHTPQPTGWPLDVGHAICIDTGAHRRRGWLTCLDVATGRVWQANQTGDTRTGWADAPP